MNVIEIGSESISFTYKSSRGTNKISMQLLGMSYGLINDFNAFANSLQAFCSNIDCNEPVILAHHCPIYFSPDYTIRNNQYIDYYDCELDTMINECIAHYELKNTSHSVVNCMPFIAQYAKQNIIPPADIHYGISYNNILDISNIKEHIKQCGIEIHVTIPASVHIIDTYFDQYDDITDDITIISISCSNTILIGYIQSRMQYIRTIGPGICDIRHSIEQCKNLYHDADISSLYFISKNTDFMSKTNLKWCIQHIMEYAKKEIAFNNLAENIILLGHGSQIALTLQVATDIFNKKIMHDVLYSDDIYSRSIFNKYNTNA